MSTTATTNASRYLQDLQLKKSSAKNHTNLLDPDATGFTFCAIDDHKGGSKLPTKTWRGSVDASWDKIVELNRQGYGVFVCIHLMDNSGHRKTANFVSVRTCVNDLDHGEPPKAYPIPPSFSVQSSVIGRHDYYLVDGEMSSSEYRSVQSAFAQSYGGDKQVKDVTRVMRLAGTYHRKTDNPFQVMLNWPGAIVCYTTTELITHFAAPEPKTKVRLVQPNSVELTVSRLMQSATVGGGFGDGLNVEKIKSALAALPASMANERDDWLKIGQSVHYLAGGDDAGLALWDDWSSQSEKYSKRDVERVWSSFSDIGSTGSPITGGTLFGLAKKNGWHPSGIVEKFVAWPEVTSSGKPDPNSAKNILFHLKANDTYPWFNEFDGAYYLGDGLQVRKLTDASFRDLRMRLHSAGCRVGSELARDNGAVRKTASKRSWSEPCHHERW